MPDSQGQSGFFDIEITDDPNLTNAIKTWESERDATGPLRKKFSDANTKFQAQLSVEHEAEIVVTDLITRRHASDIINAKRLEDVAHRYRADGWIFEVSDATDVKIAPFTDATGEPEFDDGPPAAQTPRQAAAAESGKTKDALEDDAPTPINGAVKREAAKKAKPKPKAAKKTPKK